MKNVLNVVSAILIILFFVWQFSGDCCETKCDKSDTKECDYSEWGKSGATKCKIYEIKKECPQADGFYWDDTNGGENEALLDEVLRKNEGEEDEN